MTEQPFRPAAAIGGPVRGALWMVASAALFAVMTGIVRHVSLGMHPFEIVFFRYAFGLVALVPWVLYSGAATLRTRRFGLHFGRAVLALVTVMFFFAAVAWMPLAEATALSFTAPFFTTLGAAIVLGETVRRRRWMAVAVGFAGAMIILRPGIDAVSLPALLALASAVTLAGGVLAVKTLAKSETADTIVLYQSVLVLVLAVVPAAAVWTMPDTVALMWLALIGILATLGQLAYVRAYAAADASAVVPFDYSRLIFAALIGFALFAEQPDLWTWIGSAVIFAAAVAIMRPGSV
jgi:drug/metabolite transporter (DMT)-like permease